MAGFECLDPRSFCYGFGSSTSSSIDYGDDDGSAFTYSALADGLSDDGVTPNSPGYDSTYGEGSEDRVVDTDTYADAYNAERGFSADSAGLDVQDIANGSSASSFSDVDMMGVFVLSVSAFILFGLRRPGRVWLPTAPLVLLAREQKTCLYCWCCCYGSSWRQCLWCWWSSR